MTSLPAQAQELPPIANLRALPAISPLRVFRSATLHRLGTAGREALTDLDLAAVIDLRELGEIIDAPDELEGSCTSAAWISIPLYQGPVPLSTPIDRVYRDLLERRQPQLCAAVSAVARYAASGVLVHCKAGKDRTGLVVGLTLAAAGVSRDIIAADYARSGSALPPEYRVHVTAMVQAAGLDGAEAATAHELHLESPPAALLSALDFVDTTYGSVSEYLRAGGVTATELDALATPLTERSVQESTS